MTEQVKLSQGTISLLRANLVKGIYYHDDESLIKTAEAMIRVNNDKNMIELINNTRKALIEKKFLENQYKLWIRGLVFLTSWKQKEYVEKINKLEETVSLNKKDLMNFAIANMEKEGILEKEFSRLTLKKLPLIFKGGEEEETEIKE